MNYTGKLLCINKKKFGIKRTLDAGKNVVNISVKPGIYIITEEVYNEKDDLLFIEILYKSILVLVNIKAIKKVELI